MNLDETDVFRAYDIRGIVDKDFDPQWVTALGRACAVLFRRQGCHQAILARDCRHSSAQYLRCLAKGLQGSGVDLVSIGLAPTPVFYYALKHLNRKAGVIVTASHNPPEYNGFKIWLGETTLHSQDIQELRAIMSCGETLQGSGLYSEHDVIPAYLEELAAKVSLKRPLRVVVDGGNGAAGEVCAALLERAGAEVDRLFCEPDGDFPNHHPDPVVESNLEQLKVRVLETGADCGIGLDGDGDRLGVVDEKGQYLAGDRLLAILSRDMLSRNPGATVIAEAKCSHLLYQDIQRHGGHPLMGVTGHSIMKARMLETGALLAGEMSGHMFFAENYYGFDDASYAALVLLGILAQSQTPLSEMLSDWPETYSTPELRVPCPEAAKFHIVARAAAMLRKQCETIETDGVRATFKDGWALVRASNTQPALSMRFEAETPARLQEIRDLVERPVLQWIDAWPQP